MKKSILKHLSKDSQFYPTPEKLVREVMQNFRRDFRDLEEVSFLEPCAGEGAIVRAVRDFFQDEGVSVRIRCIEREKLLRDSLAGQSFNVISEDFETFQGQPFYDLIVMNPPFKRGASFLLKAYDLLGANGELICILNSETIKNPCTRDRELVKALIERAGEVSFIEGAFADAERKTGVEIAVVHLTKPYYENEFDIFGDVKPEILTDEELIREEFREKVEGTELVSIDKVENIINLYRHCVKQIFDGIDTLHKVTDGLSYMSKEAQEFNIEMDKFIALLLEKDQEEAKEESIKLIRKMSWSFVLKACNMNEYLFTKHRQDFYDKLDKGSGTLPFTKDNIRQFFNNIFLQRQEYLQKGIIDLFEEITSYHNGNTRHREGWKTNKNWKINRKIIVDWGVQFDSYSSDKTGKFSMRYGREEWLDDLDKIVRRIKPTQHAPTIREALQNRFYNMGYIKQGESFYNICETPYFEIRFFKKGTLHITFKDENVLQELNKIGAHLRRDLGYDDYGKTAKTSPAGKAEGVA